MGALALDPALKENTGAAKGDGIADDTAALQAVLDRGQRIVLGRNETYRITRRLDITRDESGIIGDGTATLLMDSGEGAFDNAAPEGKAKYGANAVGILAQGMANVVIRGIRIRYDAEADDRYVKAIALRRVKGFRIARNDIRDFTKADGIVYIGASSDGAITGNVIRDAYTNSKQRGQITGIVLDDDDDGSQNITIARNEISNLTVGAEYKAAFYIQTDGINLTVRSRDIVIEQNRISNVGEGIDSFATRAVIRANAISDAGAFGIKLIHGASDSVVTDNVILRSGIGGIVLAGSTVVTQDTAGNLIANNVITGVNAAGESDNRFTSFGIGMLGKREGTRIKGNRITGNRIALGGRAMFGLFADPGIATANEASGNVITGWAREKTRAEPEAIRFKGQ